MTLLAFCGSASTTSAYAVASAWPTPDALLVEADPTGGDLAAWLDLPETPGVATAVTLAPTGSWPVIQAQTQSSRSMPVLVMPVRAREAAIATREAATRVFPTLSALASVTVVADCGATALPELSPVVAQAALVVVTVRQPTTSARVSAAALDRVGELVDALSARALPTTILVVGEEPYRASEIEAYVNGSEASVPVLVLASDPIGAASVGGRERLGRSFARTRLARSARSVASELAVRLDSLRSAELGAAPR